MVEQVDPALPDWMARLDATLHELRLAGAVLAPDRPTAIFASNDEMALATLTVTIRYAIAVPQRLSVVGFDDAQFARIAWPQLTTIRQPNLEMAATAVDLLVGPGAGGPARVVELPYTLLQRASSGPAPH